MAESTGRACGLSEEAAAAFCGEFKELLARHNVDVGVVINGDTHGLSCDFVVSKSGDDRFHVLAKNREFVGDGDL